MNSQATQGGSVLAAQGHRSTATSENRSFAKRTASSGQQKRKRGRYARAACLSCKAKKMKCISSPGKYDCQGCQKTSTECLFPYHSRSNDEESALVDIFGISDTSVSIAPADHTQISSRGDSFAGEIKEFRALATSLQDKMRGQVQNTKAREPTPQSAASSQNARVKPQAHLEPQFIGHTRSDFSLSVAKNMLIPSALPSPNTTRSPKGVDMGAPQSNSSALEDCIQMKLNDPILSIERPEIIHLMEIYHDELHSVYPLFDTAGFTEETIATLRRRYKADAGTKTITLDKYQDKDVRLLKMALAAAGVIDAQGHNEFSQRLVDSIECDLSSRSQHTAIDLREVQIVTLLSIYYFHCDEELMAWRRIGQATRHVLEMGLHYKDILIEKFHDPCQQAQAIKTFWCVYALDKHLSLRTGLPCGLLDREIDRDMLELPLDSQYMMCLMGYGKICSKLWDAMPRLGSLSCIIPNDRLLLLDLIVQTWLSTIPAELQFHHMERSWAGLKTESRSLERQRIILYLRGNHIKTLLYRQYVLSMVQIYCELDNAYKVADIAMDTISVLVRLTQTSDMYQRQQTAFNFFLLSAVSILILAISHAPEIFSNHCGQSFLAATELLRSLSQDKAASKRMWDSVKDVLPVVESMVEDPIGIGASKISTDFARMMDELGPMIGDG